MTDKQKNSLFIQVSDVNKNTWMLNKRNIVSVIGVGNGSRITLSSGVVIETYSNIGNFISYLEPVEHKSDPLSES